MCIQVVVHAGSGAELASTLAPWFDAAELPEEYGGTDYASTFIPGEEESHIRQSESHIRQSDLNAGVATSAAAAAAAAAREAPSTAPGASPVAHEAGRDT